MKSITKLFRHIPTFMLLICTFTLSAQLSDVDGLLQVDSLRIKGSGSFANGVVDLSMQNGNGTEIFSLDWTSFLGFGGGRLLFRDSIGIFFGNNYGIGVDRSSKIFFPRADFHIKQRPKVGVLDEVSVVPGLILENDGLGNDLWNFQVGFNDLDILYSENNEANNLMLRAKIDDATGVYSSASDGRLKESISYVDQQKNNFLNKVLQIRPAYYKFKHEKSENSKHFGVIAQDIKPLFPDLINQDEGEDSIMLVNYSMFGVIAIQAIKEQQAIIETLEKRLEALEIKTH